MFCLIILCSLLSSVVSGKSTLRIVGGEETDIHEIPYQISLKWNYNSGTRKPFHFCGGSILNKNWVITAAHCKKSYSDAGFIEIVAGDHDFTKANEMIQKRRVDKFIVHEKYAGNVGPYDIALIKLTNPFVFNNAVNQIYLPNIGEIPRVNALVSGWGSISRTKKPNYPNILRKAILPIIELKKCKEVWVRIAKTNVCAGPLDGSRSACSADSGGPLVELKEYGNKILIGIVSWGNVPCGSKNRPAVFTRVSSFVYWIVKKMTFE